MVGGNKDFIEKFKSLYVEFESDINEFKEYFENSKKEYPSIPIGWLNPLIEYVRS